MDVKASNPALSAIQTCISLGVKEYVICSGARNSALIASITSVPDAIVYHHPEERSASYFALGRSIKTQLPVVVVTTSGTAASELLPSVIEAYYQAIPLVLLTADRPIRFRGKGAPQAIEQDNLFGDYAGNCINQWGKDRPLHINVPLEEPTPAEITHSQYCNDVKVAGETLRSTIQVETQALQGFLDEKGQLMVIVGCLPLSWQTPVKDFLHRLNVPVLAEATSGVREDFPLFTISKDPERLLRIGGVPASGIWREIEEKENVAVCSVAPNGLPGLARESLVVRWPDWAALKIPELVQRTESNVRSVDFLVEKYPLSEHSWVRRLSELIPEGSLVFLGNSQPIREWNITATHDKRELRCFANRGANGIDGGVSTFLGLSVEEEDSWAVVGDLTAIYDLAAPWIIKQLPNANRRIVVINNGGGRIFRRLPALQELSESQMKLVENPHDVGFKGWAEMWSMSYREASRVSDLVDLPDGLLLIEIIPDIEQTDWFWEDFGTS
jgi:2-succinyl-5-enolpyruvyl-6-hydroxy-3-cyclohexene-1-carboxylate synthase